jgi:hypothetical protein
VGGHPAERVRTLVVTTVSNTAIAAAQSTNWTPGPGVLAKVDIVIPSGHVGLTGIQLLWGGRQVLPYDGSDFLQGNDDEITVELGLDMSGRTIQVRTYNLDDTFQHSHYLRAYLRDRQEPVDSLFTSAPALAPVEGFAPGFEPVDLGPFTSEEWSIVSTALDNFLAQLQSMLDGFLVELDARIGGGVAPAEELSVEELAPTEEPTTTTTAKAGTPVPNVLGLTQDAAKRKLRSAGFSVQVSTKRERGKEVVIAQQPDAGRVREAGFTVGITVRVNP